MAKIANSNQATLRAIVRCGLFFVPAFVFGMLAQDTAVQLEPLRHIPPSGQKIKRIPRPENRTTDNNDFVAASNSSDEFIRRDNMVHKASYQSTDGNDYGRAYDDQNGNAQRANVQPNRDPVTSNVSISNFANSNPRRREYPWTYQLQNLSYDQFEAKLNTIWGDRLLGTALDDDQMALRIFFPEGTTAPEASMKFDRLSGVLTYEGAPHRKQAWHELMQSIDRVDLPHDNYAVKIIDVSIARQGIIQQVSAVFQDQIQNPDEQDSVVVPRNLPFDRLRQEALPDFDGKIKIRISPDTNTLILEGKKEDVDKIRAFIDRVLEDPSMVDKEIVAIKLFNSTAEDLQEKIQGIFDDQLSALHGPAVIDSIPSTNSLLIVGKKSALEAIRKLIAQIDGVPAGVEDPGEIDQKPLTPREKGYQQFFLKYISAIEAERAVLALFAQSANNNQSEPGQALPVRTYVDQRSNSLTVIASQTLIRRAAALIEEMDVGPDAKTAERLLRVFRIKNHSAPDFQVILQNMLNGGLQQNIGFSESQLNAQNQIQNQQQNDNRPVSSQANIRFALPDGTFTDAVDLFDVRLNSDAASNTLTVQAPAEAMDVIAQIIEQLDQLPNINSEVKVFPIVHGDASEVLATLQAIFTGDQQGGQGGLGGQQTGSFSDLPLQSPGSDGSSLVNIRFAVSERTNTIIAAGPASDLEFVEALLYRLDEEDVQDRVIKVYRLSNASVLDVTNAIGVYLDERQTINDVSAITAGGPNALGITVARRSVIVVPEEASNSIILNARPEYIAEIELLIKRLDRRPPMVKVKAMIVQIDLDQLENYGVEFGIQDSSIFEAGLNDIIGTGFIGLDNPAGQLITDLGVGRASAEAGVGGFVLSAGDESLNFILRFLKQKGCANVLFAPQIMTMENLEGRLNQGASIQRASGVNQVVGAGVTQSFEDIDIGITLAITPRVSPDGMIVMFVDVSNSSLGSLANGTPIGTDANGNVIISRPINQTVAQTTIMARSGQTVAISGLISENKAQTITSIPFLGDLPVVGPLFQTVENTAARQELLIILTPYIADGTDDVNALNEVDFNRMHWCKCDIAEAYGDTSYTGRPYREQPVETIYPDEDPLGKAPEFSTQNEAQSRLPGTEEQLNLENSSEQMFPQNDGWRNQEQGSGNRNLDDQSYNSSRPNGNALPPTSRHQDPRGRPLRMAAENSSYGAQRNAAYAAPMNSGRSARPHQNSPDLRQQQRFSPTGSSYEHSNVTFEAPPAPRDFDRSNQMSDQNMPRNAQSFGRSFDIPYGQSDSGQYARQPVQSIRQFDGRDARGYSEASRNGYNSRDMNGQNYR